MKFHIVKTKTRKSCGFFMWDSRIRQVNAIIKIETDNDVDLENYL